ncbi:MAG TPA: diguanylate cyclase [Burkholderiaceae bacterium]|jgi:diguanylate cyclase (GGDEF)-like protein/PAS domain S-box-containing protein
MNLQITWKNPLAYLKGRVAITAGLVIWLSVTVAVVIITRSSEVGAQAAIEDSLLDVNSAARTISSRISNRERAVLSAAQRWNKQSEPTRATRAQALVQEQAPLLSLFSSLTVVGRDGQVLADSGGSTATFDTQGALKDLLAGKVPGAVSSREGGLSFAAPLRAANGAIEGALIGTLSASANKLFTDVLSNKAYGDDPVGTVIVDASGHVVTASDPRWAAQDVRAVPGLEAATEQWRAQGSPIESDPWAWRVDGQFVATAGVPEASLMIFRFASADQLLGGAGNHRQLAAIVAVSVSAAGMLAILAVTAWSLRPMYRLQKRALQVLDPVTCGKTPWPEAGGEIGRLVDVFRYVMSERDARRDERDQLLSRLEAILKHAPVGIAFGQQRRLEIAGDQYAALFGCKGCEVDQLMNQSLESRFRSPAEYTEFAAQLDWAFAHQTEYSGEHLLQRADGHTFWAHVQAAAIDWAQPEKGVIWVISDVSSRRKQQEALEWNAEHDPMTRLFNRRGFEEHLRTAISRHEHGGHSSLAVLDLDGFKAVNDTGGHAAGDAMLQSIAKILLGRARESDVVARLGGDEFALILPGCSLEAAHVLMEEVRGLIASYRLRFGGEMFAVGASIGLAQIDSDTGSVADALAVADAACYAAKHAGKNAVRSRLNQATAA